MNCVVKFVMMNDEKTILVITALCAVCDDHKHVSDLTDVQFLSTAEQCS